MNRPHHGPVPPWGHDPHEPASVLRRGLLAVAMNPADPMMDDLDRMYRLLAETQPGGIGPDRWPGWSAEVQQLLARVEGPRWSEMRVAGAGLRVLSLTRRDLYVVAVLLDRARGQWRLARPGWADATASADVQPISLGELESLLDRVRAEAGAPRELDTALPPHLELAAAREAIQRELDDASLRDLARQIEITPTALSKFLAGARPYRKTLAKLRRWMAANAAARASAVPVCARPQPPGPDRHARKRRGEMPGTAPFTREAV